MHTDFYVLRCVCCLVVKDLVFSTNLPWLMQANSNKTTKPIQDLPEPIRETLYYRCPLFNNSQAFPTNCGAVSEVAASRRPPIAKCSFRERNEERFASASQDAQSIHRDGRKSRLSPQLLIQMTPSGKNRVGTPTFSPRDKIVATSRNVPNQIMIWNKPKTAIGPTKGTLINGDSIETLLPRIARIELS